MTDILTQFIHKFDLEPKGFRGVITDWSTLKTNPDPSTGIDQIIIHRIDIYDLDGNFIRAADMNNISNNMEKFAFSFKKKEV